MMKTARLALALFLFGAGSALAQAEARRPNPGSLIFESSFDPLSVWRRNGNDIRRIVVTDEKERTPGNRSVKFLFQRSDWTDDMVGKRLAIRQKNLDFAPVGGTWWYGISIHLSNDWQDLPESPTLIWQLHGSHTGPAFRNPPISLIVDEDKINVTLYADPDVAYDCVGGTTRPPIRNLASLPLSDVTNRWVDWVVKAKLSYGADGSLDVWKDGAHVVQYTGETLYRCIDQAGELGPYMSLGPYKWRWGTNPTRLERVVMYADEIRIGNETATCDDVKPAGSPPCAP